MINLNIPVYLKLETLDDLSVCERLTYFITHSLAKFTSFAPNQLPMMHQNKLIHDGDSQWNRLDTNRQHSCCPLYLTGDVRM